MANLTVNERLAEELFAHNSLLERLVRAEADRVGALIANVLEGPVADHVAAVLSRFKTRGQTAIFDQFITLRRLDQYIADKSSTTTGKILDREITALTNIAKSETAFVGRALAESWPFELAGQKPLTAQAAKSIALSRPFNGRLLRDHWRTFDVATRTKIRQQIQIGLLAGEGTDDIVRRLVGERGGPQIFTGVRRDADTLVRTAIAHVSNHARRAVVDANRDIIIAEQWVIMLDDRVCPQCVALDGRWFRVDEGPQPPIHMRCRCARRIITGTPRQLGISMADPPPKSRAATQYDDLGAALSGTLPGETSADEWLRRQPKWVQEKVLGGKGKASLWRKGTVPLGRFIDRNGEPLTLAQMERIENEIRDGLRADRIPRLPSEINPG